MAKTKAIAQPRPQPRHKRRPADTEHITRLLVVGGVAAVLAIVVGIIGFGWYQTHIKPLGKTVLVVGSTKYNLGQLERRMELMKNQGSYYTQSNSLAALLPDDAMAELEREAKFLQGASELHISVSDDEFATEIKDKGGVSQDAKPDVYAASFKSQVKDSGLKESEFRAMVKADLLQKKLSDYFKFVAKPSEPEIKANYLIADSQDKAQAALTRISGGEDFVTVATDVMGGNGDGTLDWTPRGGSFLPDDVETFLYDTAQVNQISDPLSVNGVFYVVQLVDKDPNRALDDKGRQQVAQRDLTKWVDGLKITTAKHLSEADKQRALNDVF
jgi:parvulin-like peptidyl-prolyl isomerase